MLADFWTLTGEQTFPKQLLGQPLALPQPGQPFLHPCSPACSQRAPAAPASPRAAPPALIPPERAFTEGEGTKSPWPFPQGAELGFVLFLGGIGLFDF